MGSLNPAPVTAYLGLGSNVGNRMANLERALELLNVTAGITVVRRSSIIRNGALGSDGATPVS